MSNLQLIRQTVKEIIDLGAKSAILADAKSKEFCHLYSFNESNKRVQSAQLITLLCKEHGLKTHQLNSNVYIIFDFGRKVLNQL